METVFCNNLREIKKEKEFLEKALNVKLKAENNLIEIEGKAVDEYETHLVIEAINSGFTAKTAANLANEDFVFEKINIRDHTRRKNMAVIKARLIGKHGKTRKTIEQIGDCKIKIKENTIAIICSAEELQSVTTAIINIIKGAKQTHIYKYLEKMNAEKRKHKKE